jgi:hypothetical protein
MTADLGIYDARRCCAGEYNTPEGRSHGKRIPPHRAGFVDGADDDWASWYADCLISLSELPALLGVKPVRSELVCLLVSLDKEYTAGQLDEPWEAYYAERILGHFTTPGMDSFKPS